MLRKKTGQEIIDWDTEWNKHENYALEVVKKAKTLLSKNEKVKFSCPHNLKNKVIDVLKGVINEQDWIYKKGKNSEVLKISPDIDFSNVDEVCEYYNVILKSSGISKYISRYSFTKTATKFNNEHYAYAVDEVGFKLSKRKEKSRPNQLIEFRAEAGTPVPNLHLCEEDYVVKYSETSPKTVLDFIKRDVEWS